MDERILKACLSPSTSALKRTPLTLKNVFFSLPSRNFGKFSPTDGRLVSFKLQPCRGGPENLISALPEELVSDAKFVPVNSDDPSFGPPVMLLLGFDKQAHDQVQEILHEMGGDFLKVHHCTPSMLRGTLRQAVEFADKAPTSNNVYISSAVATSPARICFLSGLTGEEIVDLIDAWEEAGPVDTVFSAMVPNSADKPMQELITEILGDHERLTK